MKYPPPCCLKGMNCLKTDLFKRAAAFLKREAVLAVSLALAIATAFLVPPSARYLEYLDWKVLCCLFCLMAVVAAAATFRVFRSLAVRLVRRARDTRVLCACLVLLPYFLSMGVTNDVALLSLVPLAMAVLRLCGRERLIPAVVILQTVAANTGSMLTPVGNPQNLYLYSHYRLTAGEFFSCVAPLGLFALLLLGLCLLFFPKEACECGEEAPSLPLGKCLGLCALFLLSVAAVFGVLPYPLVTAAVAAALLFLCRSALKKVDYPLLLTFVCFFVFSGNLAAIPEVSSFLSGFLSGRVFLGSALVSQVVSNVPAAVLLSHFTQVWRPLLLGVNAGGCGTLVASLASLISYKLYVKEEGRGGRYLLWFTVVNIAFLILLSCFVWVAYPGL